MSGQKGGVQTKLKQIYPYAIYIHCMAHKLNIVIVDTCKYLKYLRKLFNGLEAIYVHFSYPSKQSLKEEIDAQKNKDVAEAIGIDLCTFICRFI
ncbi:zinc finger protein 862-like [Sipha flava]|uniref:Zinc finger protein 862-like n=1 Tax=Sipha flava TaxID=143950 RepID=A0A8B8F455_9HEMI|nr:zinc finger protein 862-like [Sipha flava]